MVREMEKEERRKEDKTGKIEITGEKKMEGGDERKEAKRSKGGRTLVWRGDKWREMERKVKREEKGDQGKEEGSEGDRSEENGSGKRREQE